MNKEEFKKACEDGLFRAIRPDLTMDELFDLMYIERPLYVSRYHIYPSQPTSLLPQQKGAK